MMGRNKCLSQSHWNKFQRYVLESVEQSSSLKFGLNTELNDLRKIICLRKTLISLKELQFIKSLKIWWSIWQTLTLYCLPCLDDIHAECRPDDVTLTSIFDINMTS